MKVRTAELRDLPELIKMFIALCEYLKGCDQWILNDDRKEFENGVVGFLLRKMFPPEGEESVIFVAVNDQDQPCGFLVGWMVNYPAFLKFQRVAELQYLYPLRWDTTPEMVFAFEVWGKSRCAQAVSNYATPGNGISIKLMERDGRKLAWHHFFKPLEGNHA